MQYSFAKTAQQDRTKLDDLIFLLSDRVIEEKPILFLYFTLMSVRLCHMKESLNTFLRFPLKLKSLHVCVCVVWVGTGDCHEKEITIKQYYCSKQYYCWDPLTRHAIIHVNALLLQLTLSGFLTNGPSVQCLCALSNCLKRVRLDILLHLC